VVYAASNAIRLCDWKHWNGKHVGGVARGLFMNLSCNSDGSI
jgi:hypothetical protein